MGFTGKVLPVAALVGLWAILGGSAVAQDCQTVQRLYAIEPLRDGVTAEAAGLQEATGAEGLFDCSSDQTLQFSLNLNALRDAVPVEDTAQLHGTWLGDDVLMYLAGVVVPGQEVLKIAAGPEPGSLHIRQYWIKTGAGPDRALPWVAGEGYAGLVTETWLFRDDPGKGFRADYFGSENRHGNLSLEVDRAYDLVVKQWLDRFSAQVWPALDGNALVLRHERQDGLTREYSEVVATFTRVAEGAPDAAILLVAALEVSQAQNFECFTNQISAGRGPLIDALAPEGVDGVVAMLERRALLVAEIERLRASLPPRVLPDEAHKAAMRELGKQMSEAFDDPTHLSTMRRILEAGDLGCPRLW